jgi:hypothetical protein
MTDPHTPGNNLLRELAQIDKAEVRQSEKTVSFPHNILNSFIPKRVSTTPWIRAELLGTDGTCLLSGCHGTIEHHHLVHFFQVGQEDTTGDYCHLRQPQYTLPFYIREEKRRAGSRILLHPYAQSSTAMATWLLCQNEIHHPWFEMAGAVESSVKAGCSCCQQPVGHEASFVGATVHRCYCLVEAAHEEKH